MIVNLYSINGLELRPHLITIDVSGNKNPASKGKRIEIDAFDIEP